MSFYFLHDEPQKTAEMHADADLKSAIRAVAQILCNASREVSVQDTPYKPNDHYQDVASWCNKSRSNWKWLVEAGYCLAYEYGVRLGKEHSSAKVVKWASNNMPSTLYEIGRTPPPYAADSFPIKMRNIVDGWRYEYAKQLGEEPSWSYREVPQWLPIMFDRMKENKKLETEKSK